jgi:hypothetical protein
MTAGASAGGGGQEEAQDQVPLRLRVLELARANPVPARRSRLPGALALLGLAAAAMTAALLAAGGPGHAAGRPPELGAWVVGGTVALALLASWRALPARRSMLPPPREHLLAVAVGVPLAVGLWLVFWHQGYDDPFERAGYRCLALTLATAPWPFVALAYLGRRFDPVHPGLTGSALGAAAGAWAAVTVAIWCPLADPLHVVRGHVLPLALLALLGAAAGRRLFRMRKVRLELLQNRRR